MNPTTFGTILLVALVIGVQLRDDWKRGHTAQRRAPTAKSRKA